MSGILALLRRGPGGEIDPSGVSVPPVDPDLLAQLTAAMEYRSPEGTSTWREGPVGMGQGILRTHTPGEETRPLVREDGEAGLRIVCDARLDGREEFVGRLNRHRSGPPLAWDAPVGELLLAAYRVWGPECPEHILGDYAFVIWDAPRRTLFAARDPFGVKPLFWAEVRAPGGNSAESVLVSNTLPSFMAHPGVSREPDERAIGDYLLFGYIYHEEWTYFADIRQVPRGSTLTVDPAGARTHTLWSLPPAKELRYRRRREYVGHFETLLHQAVADRLPEKGTTVIELSGGLDSGSIASAAVEVRKKAGWGDGEGGLGLHAYTVGYERLFEDPEVPLSRLTASSLGLPHTLVEGGDRLEVFPGMARRGGSDSGRADFSEVEFAFANGPGFDQPNPFSQEMAELGRVALTGWDGDALLCGNARRHLVRSIRQGRLLRVARDLSALIRQGFLQRRPPRTGLRGALRRRVASGKPDPYDGYPQGLLNPEFEEQTRLRDRWIETRHRPSDPEDVRARSRQFLEGPVWTSLFQGNDPAYTRFAIEHRNPLMDLRMVRFLQALPVIPWCVEKQIFRSHLRTRVPAAIWRRPKQGLQGDPMELLFAELPNEELKKEWRTVSDRAIAPLVRSGGTTDLHCLVDEGRVQLHFALLVHSLNRWVGSAPFARLPTPRTLGKS